LADRPSAEWPTILDEMEADLARALDPGTADGWVPPADAGSIPPHLFERAERVLGAQQRAIARLTSEQEGVAQHLAALRTVPPAGATGQSVYLDVVG
jgi:hypothetical protein